MPYTYGDIRDMTLTSLGRDADDDSIAPSRLLRAVNAARRDVWTKLGGSDATEARALDLLPGVSDYPLGSAVQRVERVSVLDGQGGATPLERVTLRDLLDRYPEYPMQRPGVTDPKVWRVWPYRAVASPALAFSSPTAWVQSILSVGVLVIHPRPAVKVSGGLLVHLAPRAAPLSADTDFSELPECIDEAAATTAALNLCAFLSGEGENPERMAALAQILAVQTREARAFLINLDGGMYAVEPAAGWSFGHVGPKARTTTGATAATALVTAPETVTYAVRSDWSHIDVTPTAGLSSVSASVSNPIPLHAADAVRAVSEQQGEIFDVDVDGFRTTFTATLPVNPDGDQQVFTAQDTVRFFFQES